jgi:hypothetical protein
MNRSNPRASIPGGVFPPPQCSQLNPSTLSLIGAMEVWFGAMGSWIRASELHARAGAED